MWCALFNHNALHPINTWPLCSKAYVALVALWVTNKSKVRFLLIYMCIMLCPFWIVLRHQICCIVVLGLFYIVKHLCILWNSYYWVVTLLVRPISYEHLSFQVICLDWNFFNLRKHHPLLRRILSSMQALSTFKSTDNSYSKQYWLKMSILFLY